MIVCLFVIGNLLAISNGFEVVDCDVCRHRMQQQQQTYSTSYQGGASDVPAQTPQECSKNGQTINEGETYRSNHLLYKCENGFLKLKGCYTNENKDLNIGEQHLDQEKGYAIKCYQKGESVGYKELFCGSNGFNSDYTACKTLGTSVASQYPSTCAACTQNKLENVVRSKFSGGNTGGYQINTGSGYTSGSRTYETTGYQPTGAKTYPSEASGYAQPSGYQKPSSYHKTSTYHTSSTGYQSGATQTGGDKMPANRCTKNGQFFNEGETYQYNHLRYQCENGIMKVKGCFAKEGKDLSAGETYVDQENKSIFQCQHLGNKIGFKVQYCTATGFNADNTACKGSTYEKPEQTYDSIMHHKVYMTKNEEGHEKYDEEKVMHVDCQCG